MSISKAITLSSSGDQRHLVRAGTAYGTSVSGSIAFSLSCHIRVSGRSGTLAKLVVASTKVQVVSHLVAAEKVSGGGGLFLGSEK